MYHRLSGKLSRIALPFVLAVLGLALLLGLFAGPRNVVHALSRRERAQVDERLASVELAPPSGVTLASSRPPQLSPQEVTQAPVVWTVCSSGCSFTSVQVAVDTAAAGDVIKVAQGTYTDSIEITKTLTLRGGYTMTNWDESYPDLYPTVLDGETLRRVIRVADSASPEIEGFHIRNGSASDGAGVYVASGSPVLRRNRIFSNTASFYGGGLYLANGTATIENCMVYDNEAIQKRGGGLYVAQGSPTVRYSVFYGNVSQEQGGGIYVAGGLFKLYGAILAGNTASDGGGIYATGSHQIDYNDYDGNTPNNWNIGFTPGSNDRTDPPQFVNAGARDFRLQPSSPCIDSGDPDRYPAIDYEGLGRYFGSAPDMGAYESYLGTCFARVSSGRVYTNVQDAVTGAASGSEVQVAGVCTGTGTNVVDINKNLTLRGGYTLTNWTDPDPDLYPTILDGETARRVINAGDYDVTIEGFHIRNGYITGTEQFGGGIRLGNGDHVIRQCRVYLNESRDDAGGGIHIDGGTFLIEHNQIYSNTSADQGGGGVSIWDASSGLIRDNDIFANSSASCLVNGCGGAGLHIGNGSVRVESNRIYSNTLLGYGGGGIHVVAGSSTIIGNEVYSNTQSGVNGGGGIYIDQASSVVERNAVYGNSANASFDPGGGGGIYIEGGTSTVRNNLIYSNTVGTAVDTNDLGGGIFRYGGSSTIENNTFYGNQAGTSGSGGGIYINNPGGAIRNNIVANNVNGEGVAPTSVCEYCDVWGNTANTLSGTGSISVDPLFVQPGVDFRLQSGSPCRDQADPGNYSVDDYNGYARPFGTRADIGAYEYYEGVCYARVGAGQVYSTVQAAILTAPTSSLIKVAGRCTGSGTAVAAISKTLTLRGGYTHTNWLTPSTQTILDGEGTRRGVHIYGTDPVTVDGFIIRDGGLATGAGLYNQSSGDVKVHNIIFYDNAPASGSILASAGGNAQLYNNTLVDNDIGGTGWVISITAGSVTVSNTIIVSNTGNTVSGASCSYCFIDQDPKFVDYAGDDFRLRSDSPCVYAADPDTDLDHDFEGDPRPLGYGFDIGADECAAFPGLLFEPEYQERLDGAPGRTTVYTHILTNTGGVADVFDLTYSIHVTGTGGWSVDHEPSVSLDEGASTVVQVDVSVPTDEISGAVGIVVLTATSQLNPALYEVVTNVTYISWNPGVTMTPVFSGFLNPGDIYTQANTLYQHTLLNTGNAPDSFTLTLSSPRGWAGITPTVISNLAPGASATIWFTIEVPPTMPGGVTETVVITAVNSTLEAWAVITNVFEVNHVPGTRYVAPYGSDTENNCRVIGAACQTIKHAVDQTVNGDTVLVLSGLYHEHDLQLNKPITVTGGFTTNAAFNSWWEAQYPVPDPDLNPTIVDAQGQGRLIEIWGNAVVEALTLRGGSVSGSGGGVYIGSGSPILRNNLIISNTAGARGGGIYNSTGTPTIEQNEIAHNTATWGGGFATGSATPSFWNNLVYANTALDDGGGVYVGGGGPLIWHDTIYGNDADRGGGVFVEGGSPVVSNTIIATNTAEAIVGATCHYCDLYGNDDNTGGDANSLYEDPKFVDKDAYDLHLAPGSPCTDTADISPLLLDLDGDPRVVGSAPDIGADEFVWGTIEFTPDYSGVVSHCLSISYQHIVTHTGRYTDTFDFSWVSSEGVIATIVPPQVVLGHDMTATIDVQISVPCTVTGPVKDTTVLTVASQSHAFINNQVTETNYIDVQPVLVFEPDQEATSPPTTIYYTHTLTNDGNYTDTISFEFLSSNGWPVSVVDAVTLGPQQSTVVTVTVTIPGDVLSGTVDTTIVTATTMFSDMVNGIPVNATVVNTTTVAPFRAIDVAIVLPARGWCVWPPGSEFGLPFPFSIYNIGNITDTYDLESLLIGHPALPVTITPATTTTLPGFQQDLAWVSFTVPPSGTLDQLVLTATSQTDPGVWDTDYYSLFVEYVDLEWDEPVTHTVFLGTVVTYQHTLTNNSDFATDIGIALDPGISGWSVVFSPDNLTLAAHQTATIQVTITIPILLDPPIVDQEVSIQARSSPCVTETVVIDTILVRRPGVTIEPDRFNEEASPGSVVTYTYFLSNTGAVTDTFTLTWTQPSSAWPTWTVAVSPTKVISLVAHSGVTVTAVMTVPDGMPAGERGQYVITATSFHAKEIYDIAVTDLVVPPRPMARITPDHQGQARPGEWITYTHILTNVGNVADLFEITTRPGDYATAEILGPTSVWLAPTEVYTGIVVRVSILPHAQIGEVDETRVIVSFGEVLPGGGRQQVVAVDSTTIIPFAGTRYVAPGGTDEGNNCTVPLDEGPCATIQHAVDQASPGDEIRVATGTYADIHSTNDVTQVVYLDKSVILRGGYVHPEWQTFDPFDNPTTIDALGQGRAIYVATGITPTIVGFHLTGGYLDQVGEHGAGLYIAAGAVPTVEMNVIHNNTAQGIGAAGGGVYYGGPGGFVLQQNTLYGNEAEDGSGAYIVGDAKVWNNVFHSNVATSLGGGLYLDGGSPTVWNNTFFENTADRGGGVYKIGSGTAVISNTIFAQNTCNETNGGAAVYQGGGTVDLDYNDYYANNDSIAMSSGGAIPTGTHSLSVDPLFVNPAAYELHLKPSSPCIDAGDPSTVVDEDRDGKVRPLRDGYDMGAYEYGLEFAKVGPADIAPGQNYVYTIVITNTGNLDRQNVPVTDTLSPYLEFVSSPTGQYIPATRTITWTVSISRNSTVQLDFTAQVTSNLSAGDAITNVAWVDLLQTNELTSVYRTCWVRLNDDPTDYTAVQAAVDASQYPTDVVKVAGTCLGVEARAGISQVVYLSKTLTVQGGWNTSFAVRDVGLYTSTLDALGQGRVIYVTGDVSPTIEGLFITNGDASGDAGGGVYVVTATATLEGNVILNNTADIGGGVCLVDSASTLINNAIIDNQATTAGSGLYVDGNNVTMLHNTLARNGGAAGHGIYVTDLASPATVALTNTIVATHTVGIQAAGGSTAVVSSVLWYDNTTDDSGNVSISDPHFGDPAFDTDGYHLTIRSAARDQGLEAGVVDDIDGDSRLAAGVPDLGADEILASLQVIKVASPDPVNMGDQITYTIRVTNTGGVDLDAIVTDTRPSEVVPTGVITWDLGTLAPGQSEVRTFVVTVTAGYSGPLVNRVDVASIYGITATHTVTSSAEGSLEIAVTKDVEPALAEAGEQITYTIYVTNTGTVDLNVTVTDTLPTQVTLGGTRVWTPFVLSGEVWTATIPVVVQMGYSGTLTNTVEVTSVEGATGTFTLLSEARVTPALSVTKQVEPTTVDPGTQVTYTIIVTNTGNVTLTATITDILPAQVSPGGTPTWPAVIAPGGVWSQTIVVTVSAAYAGPLVNQVQVTTDEGATGSDTVVSGVCTPLADLTLEGPSAGTPGVGQTFTATIVPPTATMPLTYTWEATGHAPRVNSSSASSDVETFTWTVAGTYVVTVTVDNDCGGTISRTHVIAIESVQPVYLPLVMRSYFYAPDLEVTAIQVFWGVGANPDYVQVTIRNNGPAPVTADFWVDLYLDPSRVPTVGDLWSDLSSQGKAWVVRNPTILPGATIVLDTRDPDDPADPGETYSDWPDQLPAGGHTIYAQADSYWRPSGLIIETDETNNVLSQTYVQGVSQPEVPTPPAPPVLDTPVPISTPKPRPTPEKQPVPTPEP
jgi:uncharacterized repeat protein (TIGR01451 family)